MLWELCLHRRSSRAIIMQVAVSCTPLPVLQHLQLQELHPLPGLQASVLPEEGQTQRLYTWGNSAASPAMTCRTSPLRIITTAPTHTERGIRPLSLQRS